MINLVREEMYTGEITGTVNVTKLRKWLNESGRQPLFSGMMIDNVLEQLEAHIWDETFDPRLNSLIDLGFDNWLPMIYIKESDGPPPIGFIVDGWHRLAILYNTCFHHKQPIVPFHAFIVTPEECKQFPHSSAEDPSCVGTIDLNGTSNRRLTGKQIRRG